MLAVRRVTQENQGKTTAGVDGVKAVGPLVRLLFVERLRHAESIRAQPVRRVLIPKAGKPGQWRPLGIPMWPSYCTVLQGSLGMGWVAVADPPSIRLRRHGRVPRLALPHRFAQRRDRLGRERNPARMMRGRLDGV